MSWWTAAGPGRDPANIGALPRRCADTMIAYGVSFTSSFPALALLLAGLFPDNLAYAGDAFPADRASWLPIHCSGENQAGTIHAEMRVTTRHHLGRDRCGQTNHALTAFFGLELIIAVVFLLLLVVRAAHGVVGWHVCLDGCRRNDHLPVGR